MEAQSFEQFFNENNISGNVLLCTSKRQLPNDGFMGVYFEMLTYDQEYEEISCNIGIFTNRIGTEVINLECDKITFYKKIDNQYSLRKHYKNITGTEQCRKLLSLANSNIVSHYRKRMNIFGSERTRKLYY